MLTSRYPGSYQKTFLPRVVFVYRIRLLTLVASKCDETMKEHMDHLQNPVNSGALELEQNG
jgi:hypothetical protein